MEYQTEYIDIEKLYLDDSNPRLPKSLHNKEQKEIIEYLLLEESTIELMQAIGKNDFFPGEQLLVTAISHSNYKVIEGNRRLASLKLLKDYSITSVKKNIVKKVYDEADYRPESIPCIVFSHEDDIRKYIGFRHITGIKAWGLSEKARYLSEMKEKSFKEKSLNDASYELAKIIGSRTEYVKRVLVGFELFKIIEDEAYYKIRSLDDTNFYIGYFVDSLNRTNIASFLGIDLSKNNPLENINTKNLKKITHWFFEKNEQNQTRLKGKSQDLNMLNSVLGSSDATIAFDEDGKSLEKAYEFTKDYNKFLETSIKKAIENLDLADKIILKVSEFYSDIDEDLKYIGKITRRIKNSMEDAEDI